MDWLWEIDWRGIFVPDVSPLETVVRGTLIYLGIFVLLRLIVKREIGGTSMADILVVVLLADAAQNGMSNGYHTVTNGLILVATVLLWSFLIDWLTSRLPAVRRLLIPQPLLLVDNGRMLRRNMRREFISEEELISAVREKGYDGLDKIKKVYMESDGEISVVPASN